ncbi:hypothetical protein [Staphylococcus saprophyticus]|nr:hypothetical protein [Staphylococcus saprophyticus]
MLKFEEVETQSLNGWGAVIGGIAAGGATAGGAAAIGIAVAT